MLFVLTLWNVVSRGDERESSMLPEAVQVKTCRVHQTPVYKSDQVTRAHCLRREPLFRKSQLRALYSSRKDSKNGPNGTEELICVWHVVEVSVLLISAVRILHKVHNAVQTERNCKPGSKNLQDKDRVVV